MNPKTDGKAKALNGVSVPRWLTVILACLAWLVGYAACAWGYSLGDLISDSTIWVDRCACVGRELARNYPCLLGGRTAGLGFRSGHKSDHAKAGEAGTNAHIHTGTRPLCIHPQPDVRC
jgi:hypothetical protein